MGIEQVLSHITRALRVPVLVLAVVALAVVLADLGALVVELAQRRRRSLGGLETHLAAAQEALRAGDISRAEAAVRAVAVTADMARVLTEIVLQLPVSESDERIAKRLADYDYRHLRRLERTRILVRFGPALGLMGTLIPLTPALSGLAKGNVSELTSNLEVAFSVTVTGLLVGAIAFAISLVRDRLYGQDYSDVEYVAATLSASVAARPSISSSLSDASSPAASSSPAEVSAPATNPITQGMWTGPRETS
jgi:biopolymer transport protein ExbB/TolQ